MTMRGRTPNLLNSDRNSLRSRWKLAGAAVIIVLTVVAYWHALPGQFIWDDELYLTKNAQIKAPDGLAQFWFTTNAYDYWPLSNSTLWLEWRLWRMNPLGYHVTNLALHIVSALLLWAILRQLVVPGAFFAAFLFALHPLNIESVAWIAQRKGALALVLMLASIGCYLRAGLPTHASGPSERRWNWLSIFAFVLAMLSKGSVAMLPVILIAIDWWKIGSVTIKDLRRISPFLIVAAVLTAVNIWFQYHESGQAIRHATLAERFSGAGAVIWFYLSKSLLPINLIFFYPQWRIDPVAVIWWIPLAAAAATSAMLLPFHKRAAARPVLVAWVMFVAALVPVMGMADVYFMKYSLVADHYAYAATIPVVALAAAGIVSLSRQLFWSMTIGYALCGAGAAALTVLAFLRSSAFADPVTIYERTVSANPTSGLALNNLGVEYKKAGRLDDALRCYNRAMELDSNDPEALANIGGVLQSLNRTSEAVAQFEKALAHKPDLPDAQYALGTALLTLGQYDAAAQHFQRAIDITHEYFPEAQNGLGLIELRKERPQQAIEHFKLAIQADPDSPDPRNSLASAFLALDRPDEAIEQYEILLQTNPAFAEGHYNLATVLVKRGRSEEAIPHYREALRLKPDFADAHFNYGNLLFSADNPREAAEHYEAAIRSRSDFSEAYATLATAYAKLQRRAESISAAQKAVDLFRAQGKTGLADQMQSWLHANPSP